MAYQYRSEAELRFTAKYIRSLGIGGISVSPIFILIGLVADVPSGWRFILIGTGIGMLILGAFEYRVASRDLKNLSDEVAS